MELDVSKSFKTKNLYHDMPTMAEYEQDYGIKKRQKRDHLKDAQDQFNKFVQGRAKITPKVVACALKWNALLEKRMIELESQQPKKAIHDYFRTSDKLLMSVSSRSATKRTGPGGKKYYAVQEPVLVNGVKKVITRVYGGITQRLCDVFYPDTSDNPIEKSKRNRELGGRKPLIEAPFGMQARPCLTSGAEHGNTVHSQFEKITGLMTSKVFDEYSNQNEDVDPCVESFVNVCIKNKWIPFRSEMVIYDKDIKLTTAIDMILIDTNTWKLILIEFKTGFEDEEYGQHPNDVPLEYPLESITNCPLNRHLLQLTVMSIMLEAKYQTLITDAYVVRMCPKAGVIEMYAAPKWYKSRDYRRSIYNRLLEYAQKKL